MAVGAHVNIMFRRPFIQVALEAVIGTSMVKRDFPPIPWRMAAAAFVTIVIRGRLG